MKKSKAVFVTALLAVMLAAILVMLLLLKVYAVVAVVLGLLAAVGFWEAVCLVFAWLYCDDEDEDLTPPVVVGADATETEDEPELTYEAIRREVQAQT